MNFHVINTLKMFPVEDSLLFLKLIIIALLIPPPPPHSKDCEYECYNHRNTGADYTTDSCPNSYCYDFNVSLILFLSSHFPVLLNVFEGQFRSVGFQLENPVHITFFFYIHIEIPGSEKQAHNRSLLNRASNRLLSPPYHVLYLLFLQYV
jgi:hypothetical protein